MSIQVYRGAATSSNQKLTEAKVDLGPKIGKLTGGLDHVRICFPVVAGGQGQIDVYVAIDPSSFIALAEAMLKSNPEAAVKAFGSALAKIDEIATESKSAS